MVKTRLEVRAGDPYGRLSVVREVDPLPTGKIFQRAVECECQCGSVKVYRLCSLRSGNTQSCGCYAKEQSVERGHRLAKAYPGTGHLVHGGSGTPEYNAWRSMISRCADLSNLRYGGRGIRVCERWLGSFPAFLEDMGRRPSPGHSIDRKDNDGNYEPGNCRWATVDEQARNRSNTVRLTFRGETLLLLDWCERLELDPELVRSRIDRGWSAEDAFTKPTDGKHTSDPFFRVPISKRDANWYREYERRQASR